MKKIIAAFVLAVSLHALPAVSQVSVGVIVGHAPVYTNAPVYTEQYIEPVCEWGYYNYYPYQCAPYGYYDSGWFVGRTFIGIGPWFGHRWYGGAWRGPRPEGRRPDFDRRRGFGDFRNEQREDHHRNSWHRR